MGQPTLAERDAWLNPKGTAKQKLSRRTRTNLYDQRRTRLDLAQRKLNEAVLEVYG